MDKLQGEIKKLNYKLSETTQELNELKDKYSDQMREIKHAQYMKGGTERDEWIECDRCPIWSPVGTHECIHIPDDDGTLLEEQHVCEACWIKHREATGTEYEENYTSPCSILLNKISEGIPPPK